MFYFFSKFLSFLILPLNWIVGLFLYSLFGKKETRKKKALKLGVVLLLFLSNPIVGNLIASWWEAAPVPVHQLKETYDYGVILGGFSKLEGEVNEDRLHLGSQPNRLSQTLDLYFQGKIKKIILSGGNGNIVGHKENEAQITALFLERIGVPKKDYIIEKMSRNTFENFENVKKIMRDKTGKKCLIITSAFHVPRSQAIAQKVGLECDFFPTDFFKEKWSLTPSQTFIPDAKRLQMWKYFIKEWVGFMAYKIKGYI